MQTTAPMHAAHAEEHHPSTSFYWKVGAVLFVITAIEVALYYIVDPHVLMPAWAELTLYAFSTVKFIGVVAYFMHLYFDSKLFTAFFVTGLILAASTILAILSLVGAFGKGSVPGYGAEPRVVPPATAPAAPGAAAPATQPAAGH